jgi:hypothetical protein
MAHPILPQSNFSFVPKPNRQNPVYNGVACFEKIYRMNTDCQLELKWLIKTYETTNKAKFFNFFTKLAGTQNSNNKLKTESQKH